MNKSTVLILSVAVLSLGYLLYTPLPPNLLNPWRGRTIIYVMSAIEAMASLGERITGKPMTHYLSLWTNSYHLLVNQNYPDVEVQDKHLDGVEVKVYRPKAVTGLIPAVIFFHGGGWVIGNIDFYDGIAIRMALQTNMTIITVNYRKAPAHPYPIPFEDSLQATQYVLQHGKELGVDSTKVVVAGDSAGGNLAAAVSLRLSQRDSTTSKIPPLKLQVLLYPVMQAFTFNTASYRDLPEVVLSQKRMIMYWTAYLGIPFTSKTLSTMLQDKHVSADLQKSAYGSYVKKGQSVKVVEDYDPDLAGVLESLIVDPFVSPLMADSEDLKRVPPAWVVACEFDQLRDEAIWYAERLNNSGVSTDLWVIQGQTHPILPFASFPVRNFNNQDFEEIIETISKYIVSKVK